MWFCAPSTPPNTGKMNKARKASILPALPAVISGRATITAIKATVMPSNTRTNAVGMNAPRLSLLLQRTDVLNQALDLIVSQFALIALHLAFAFLYGLNQFCVRHFGHFGRVKVLNLQFLSSRRIPLAIWTVADLAFDLIECSGIVLSESACGKSKKKGNSQHRGYHSIHLHGLFSFCFLQQPLIMLDSTLSAANSLADVTPS